MITQQQLIDRNIPARVRPVSVRGSNDDWWSIDFGKTPVYPYVATINELAEQTNTAIRDAFETAIYFSEPVPIPRRARRFLHIAYVVWIVAGLLWLPIVAKMAAVPTAGYISACPPPYSGPGVLLEIPTCELFERINYAMQHSGVSDLILLLGLSHLALMFAILNTEAQYATDHQKTN